MVISLTIVVNSVKHEPDGQLAPTGQYGSKATPRATPLAQPPTPDRACLKPAPYAERRAGGHRFHTCTADEQSSSAAQSTRVEGAAVLTKQSDVGIAIEGPVVGENVASFLCRKVGEVGHQRGHPAVAVHEVVDVDLGLHGLRSQVAGRQVTVLPAKAHVIERGPLRRRHGRTPAGMPPARTGQQPRIPGSAARANSGHR